MPVPTCIKTWTYFQVTPSPRSLSTMLAVCDSHITAVQYMFYQNNIEWGGGGGCTLEN